METRYQKRMRIKNNKSFQIFVKTLNGKTIVVDSREQTTLLELKKIIGKRNGLASQNIVLRGGIHMLDDFKSLEENKIANNSTLHMTLRLKGGTEDTAVVSSSRPRPTGASGANPGPPIGPRPLGVRPKFGNIPQQNNHDESDDESFSSSGDEADVLAAPREEPAKAETQELQQQAAAPPSPPPTQTPTPTPTLTEPRPRQEEGQEAEEKAAEEKAAKEARERERAAQEAREAQERADQEAREAQERAEEEARAKKKREEEEEEEEEKLQTVKKEKHEMSSRDLKIRQLEFDYYNNYNPGDGELAEGVKQNLKKFNKFYMSIKQATLVKEA